MITVPMTVSASAVTLPVNVAGSNVTLPLGLGAAYIVGTTPEYTGEYVFTPSPEEQIININGYKATENITINPIPSNYGLITWNGSKLTVS